MRRVRQAQSARWGRRWDTWSPAEERWLADLAAQGWGSAQLARQLAREFGVPRTPGAVHRRASTLGLSLASRALTLADLERLFGVDGGTILRRWIADGYLRAQPRHGRGRAPHWRFLETDVEAFVRAHPWLYDWRRMQPGQCLRSIAEVVHRSDPWLTLAEVAARTKLSIKQLRVKVVREEIPHERRWHGKAPHGSIVVRAADLRVPDATT